MFGQQPSAGDELGLQRRTPGTPPVPQGNRGLCLVDGCEGVLDIDTRTGGKIQAQFAATPE